jgi:signal transduction histidine kinase
MKKSIAKKLIIYFLFLSLVSTAIIGLYSYRKAREALIDRTYEQLVSLRTEKENRLISFFNQRVSDAAYLAGLYFSGDYAENSFRTNRLIQGLLASNQGFESCMYLYDGHELYVLNSANAGSKLVAYEGLIKNCNQQIANHKPFVFELIPGLHGKRSSIIVGVPEHSNEQVDKKMILLEVKPDAINEIMFEDNPYNGLGQSGESYLVGSDYLMRSNSRFKKDTINQLMVNTDALTEAFLGKTGTKKIHDYRNIPVFSAFDKVNIEGINWVVLAEIDVKEAMIPIYNVRNNIIYLSLLIALLLIGIVALLANMIAAPLKNLKIETEKVSKGIYGMTIENTREDEIGALINAFNTMTLKLKEQTDKLETERMLRLSSMIDGQEMERQRLSRELHDSLGQLLLAIKMKLEKALHVEPDLSKSIIDETLSNFSATIQEVRNISNNLMPAVLSEFGLITGLRVLSNESAKNAREKITFSSTACREMYSKKIDTYLYRIAQEGLNNALKYAKASVILLHLEEKQQKLILQITDNGIGIQEPITMGNGILNMRERSKLLGGELFIDSNPNKGGCKIEVIIPIN